MLQRKKKPSKNNAVFFFIIISMLLMMSSVSAYKNYKDLPVLSKEQAYKTYWNYTLVNVTPTGSMKPTINDTTRLVARPMYRSMAIGDIIIYDGCAWKNWPFTKIHDNYLMHRIIKINKDKQGLYATTQGDNVWISDPNKVRQKDIKLIIIGYKGWK